MGVISKIRDSADDKIDTAFNLATAEVMRNYYPRWCEISEVENPDNIDYTIPCIELESKLCDPRNLKMIRRGKHTQEFLERLNSD